jgi:iron complex outermembrane receptor protein
VNAQDFTNFAPKLGVEYHPTDTVMVYGSWSKGFKTGSWTTRLSNPHPTYDATLHFDPEKATSEEIGIKSELFERRLRLNVAGFHTKYRNIQLNSQQGISPTFLNAGDARIWGFEVEAQAVINSNLSVNSSLGYLDAKYTRVAPGVGDNGVNITTAFKLPKTPELKFNIGPQLSFDLANKGKAQFNLDYTHTSTVYNDLGNTALLKRPVIDEFNLSGTYKSPDGRWELTTGVTNLTDKRYVVTGQNQGGVAVVFATYNRPREWFATLRTRF